LIFAFWRSHLFTNAPFYSLAAKIAFDQIVDCHCGLGLSEDLDANSHLQYEARISVKTRPEYDVVKTTRLIRPELVIPALKDGEVFQKLISAMKGQHCGQEMMECDCVASINIEDLFGHDHRDNAPIPPVWQNILMEIRRHSPES
jgi:hypothetical protein